MFLELLARSIQERHSYPEAARRIFGRLANRLGQSLAGPGSVDERGMQVVGAAATAIVAQTLAPAAVATIPAKKLGSLRAVRVAPASG